jgi:hypothetical protein
MDYRELTKGDFGNVNLELKISRNVLEVLTGDPKQGKLTGNLLVIDAGWFSPGTTGGVQPLDARGSLYHYYTCIKNVLEDIKMRRGINLHDDLWLAAFRAPSNLRLNPHTHYGDRNWYEYRRSS